MQHSNRFRGQEMNLDLEFCVFAHDEQTLREFVAVGKYDQYWQLILIMNITRSSPAQNSIIVGFLVATKFRSYHTVKYPQQLD